MKRLAATVSLGTLLSILLGCSLLSADLQPQIEKIARLLQLERGATVADIGAGDGDWSIELARWLGPEGRVLATEIDASEVSKIERNVKRSGVPNVTAILSGASSAGLETESCDGILLRFVYHHFDSPQAMRSELYRVLKEDRRIALIDFKRGYDDHGVDAEEVISDMLESGFTLVERIDSWDDNQNRYLLVFQK